MMNIAILMTQEYMAMTDTDPFLKKFQKEMAAGTVSLVLLTVLSRARQPLYGYQIAKQLEGGSEGVIAGKQSALYPVLRNLEGAGLADSEVEPSISGPPRRYYRITELGRTVQRLWAESWHATRDFVDRTLVDPSSAEKRA
jgi:PadR family transcriptional regulator PadR